MAYTGATIVLVAELDAGQLKCPSSHIDRLRLHAKPVSYRFPGCVGSLAADCPMVWPLRRLLRAAAAREGHRRFRFGDCASRRIRRSHTPRDVGTALTLDDSDVVLAL